MNKQGDLAFDFRCRKYFEGIPEIMRQSSSPSNRK